MLGKREKMCRFGGGWLGEGGLKGIEIAICME